MSRKCRECGNEIPTAAKSETTYHKAKFCGWDCMTKYGMDKARKNNEKRLAAQKKIKDEEFKQIKERVDAQGNKAKAMKSAQSAFNAYIRERDAKQPCISCGKDKAVSGGYRGAGGFDAGHYRSRGASPELRFNEDNCFKQCVACNRDKSGNVVNMRINIKKRIGEERLAIIEGPHDPKRYTLEDLKEIAATYRAKLKELKRINSGEV